MAQSNAIDKHVMYHTLSIDETFKELDSRIKGLTDDEVVERLSMYGKNQLKEGKKKSILRMLYEQFKNVMIIILLAAALISGFMGELADTGIILAVVIINAVLGVFQESKAEKALEALKKMSAPFAKVKRNGEVVQIKSEDIVPGDFIMLEAGDYVPADIRLIEAASLKIEEAALTGESVPVDKITEAIEKDDIVIGDRKNMAYMGSSVTYGRGTGIVVSTGMDTEVGKIAGYITTTEEEMTPLQMKLDEIGKFLSIGIVIIAVIIFIAGVMEGRKIFDMFLTAVSLAVAAIPEGLPAIVTIVLALGVQRMAKKNSIIRKLPAVETLGSTEIICSDKTGTLTQNRMTVKKIYANGKLNNAESISGTVDHIKIFMDILTLCNDSKISTKDGKEVFLGDPTETALVDFTKNNGINKSKLDGIYQRVSELPFDSERKLMTTINKVEGKLRAHTKGAVDMLINRCSYALINGEKLPLSDEIVQEISIANKSMGSKALRVLATAYKDLEDIPENMDTESLENDLVFVGLIGMIDPPREEVKKAVQVCKEAGIRPIMITGDHRDTAFAIAKELDIVKDESEVLTGVEIDKITDEDFVNTVPQYSVYARVSPEHKVRIVDAWKKRGKTVAMTGDGVNDAPALKKSDIGVGMGITGTDVAKGVSDMVLSDDNFATIVDAVKEGRKIYSNIKKSIQFLLSSNVGEVITLFVATMLNWTILLPIHILWINLVTDTFPALALGVEREEKDIMKQKPRKAKGNFFGGGVGVEIAYQGAVQAAITLGVFYFGFVNYTSLTAVTMAFATLGLIQLAHAFNLRSSKKSIFSMGAFTNPYLIYATIVSALLQVVVIIVPGLNGLFKVAHLTGVQWGIVILAALSIIPVVEIVKLGQRMFGRK